MLFCKNIIRPYFFIWSGLDDRQILWRGVITLAFYCVDLVCKHHLTFCYLVT